ncbi:MAG: hypothetical protein LIO46_03860, partial [Clostridiales bacterium]|nr:hypothetical protein [Clostridiales bacterium]
SSNDYTTADQTAVQNELPSRLDEVETTLKNLPTEVNDITEILKGKVDVEEGKGLSSNDFTNSHKTKLDALPDNSALSASLAGKVDKADGKGLSSNDYTTADQTAVQSTLPNRIDTLEGKLNSFPEEWEEIGDLLDSKVDKVDGKDLSTNDYDNAAKSIVDSVPEQIAAINETAQNAGKTAEEAKTDVQSLQDDVVNYLNPDAFSIGNLLKFDGERLVPAVRGVDYDAGNGGSISGDSIVSYYESPLEFKLVLSEASLENAIIARDEDAISQLFCVFDKIQLPHQAGAILGQEISFHFDGFDESEEALAVLLLETFSVVVNVVIQLLGTVSAVAAMLLYGLDEEEAIAFTEAFMQCSYYNAKAIWLGQLIDLNDILAYDADGNFTGFNVDTWQNKVSAKHLRTVRYTPKDGTTTIKYIPKFIESLPFTMAFTLLGMPTAENKDFAELLMALALAPIALLAQLDREINQLYQNGESKYDNLEAFIKRF